jgi:hypothetical protein
LRLKHRDSTGKLSLQRKRAALHLMTATEPIIEPLCPLNRAQKMDFVQCNIHIMNFQNHKVIRYRGCAIAQAVSRWLLTAAARVRGRGLVMWDLWWTKWRCGRFSPSTSVSPANLHSTNFSIITIIWGWYNRPVVAAVPSGLSLTPLTIIIKNIC